MHVLSTKILEPTTYFALILRRRDINFLVCTVTQMMQALCSSQAHRFQMVQDNTSVAVEVQ